METSALLVMLGRLLSLIDQNLAPPSPADIRDLGDQALRLTSLLVRLAERAAVQTSSIEISAPAVDSILEARRRRADHLGPDIGDAAWALLLTVYAARLDGRCYSASKLGQAAGLPATTALSWVHRLHERGLLAWYDDPEDDRAALIDLSDEGAARLEAYLRAALRISPVIF